MRAQHIHITDNTEKKTSKYQLIISVLLAKGFCTTCLDQNKFDAKNKQQDQDLYLNVIKRERHIGTGWETRDNLNEYCYNHSQDFITYLKNPKISIKDLETKKAKSDFLSMIIVELARLKEWESRPNKKPDDVMPLSKQEVLEQIKLKQEASKGKSVEEAKKEKPWESTDGYVIDGLKHQRNLRNNFLKEYEKFKEKNPDITLNNFEKNYRKYKEAASEEKCSKCGIGLTQLGVHINEKTKQPICNVCRIDILAEEKVNLRKELCLNEIYEQFIANLPNILETFKMSEVNTTKDLYRLGSGNVIDIMNFIIEKNNVLDKEEKEMALGLRNEDKLEFLIYHNEPDKSKTEMPHGVCPVCFQKKAVFNQTPEGKNICCDCFQKRPVELRELSPLFMDKDELAV